MPQPGGRPGGKAGGGKQRHRKQFHAKQQKRSNVEADEIAAIEAALEEGAPARGSNPLAAASAATGAANGAATAAGGAAAAGAGAAPAGWAAARRFDDLPISEYSKQGLREAKYINLTAVQRAALPHALCGRDVLGAAKTGSGAAATAPLLPCLACLCWAGCILQPGMLLVLVLDC